MRIQALEVFVGEDVPIRYSFLSRLKDFQSTNMSLVGASVAWVSKTPAVATFDVGSGGLVSSDQGVADGIPNDAVIGRFTAVAAGICTVYVSVDTINPVSTLIGVVQLRVEAVPTP